MTTKTKSRFWVSFYFLEEDYRPLTFPPVAGILGYWASGVRCSDDATTLCIWVEADSEKEAREIIAKDWPESTKAEWRFFDACEPDWKPGDRFPMQEWSKKRVEKGEIKS